MIHECPTCGQECYCDGEDHGQDAPEDCSHCEDDDSESQDDSEPTCTCFCRIDRPHYHDDGHVIFGRWFGP